jgi:hyperosmotically inducible periplasmic protein
MHRHRAIASALYLVAVATTAIAQSSSQPGTDSTGSGAAPVVHGSSAVSGRDSRVTKSDNTRSNKTTDLRLTQQIGRSSIDGSMLSVYAHNIRIVAVDGTVTLNGVVRSQAEKDAIERRATVAAGPGRFVNNLKIASSSE